MGAFTPNTPRSFRIVAAPSQIMLVEALLQAEGFVFEPEPFSPCCRRLLAQPLPAGASLAAFFGWIYLQDRSSMLPPLALSPAAGAAILDLAASPGSKAGFLAQLAGPRGMVLANEPNSARLATLRANLRRLNLPWAATCSSPGEKLPLAPASWQYILLDPPCSGWGTQEKNPRAAKLWQGDKIGRLCAIQRGLLAKAASLLAPGGRLVYSTCTTNPPENEEMTRFACDSLGLEPVQLAPFAGFVFEQPHAGALLVDGAASAAQGFYISLLQKPGAPARANAPDVSPQWQGIDPQILRGPLFDPDLLPPGQCAAFGGKLRFLPLAASVLPPALRWQGALLGKWADGRLVPDPRLRAFFPADAPRLVFEDVAPLRQLLSGASLAADLPAGPCALYWRQLPLCGARIQNGRVLLALR